MKKGLIAFSFLFIILGSVMVFAQEGGAGMYSSPILEPVSNGAGVVNPEYLPTNCPSLSPPICREGMIMEQGKLNENGCYSPGTCVYANSIDCAIEGESIPVGPGSKECCSGLVLCPPPESTTAGSRGIILVRTGSAGTCKKSCTPSTTTCIDSDGGKNYYVKGSCNDSSGKGEWVDSCKISSAGGIMKLEEAYCGLDNYCYGDLVECSKGCRDGVCLTSIATCVSYAPLICPKGNTLIKGTLGSDGCYSPSKCVPAPVTIECKVNSDCYPPGFIAGKCGAQYTCSGGKCEVSMYACPAEKPVEAVCQGCTLDSSCYPLGYRKGANYCSEGKSFDSQKAENTACENSFECESNMCISEKCMSQGFLDKIISWFARLFGR